MSGALAQSTLATLAAQIREHHQAAGDTLKRAVAHAITAGELLLEAKRKLKHGNWLSWLQENCEIPERTVQAYMRLARLPIEKRNAVADLPLREALSAIRSREQKLADAAQREAKQADTYSGVVYTDHNGVSYYGREAAGRIPPGQYLPSPPRTAADYASGLVEQFDQALYEIRDDVDVADVRRAVVTKLAEYIETQPAQKVPAKLKQAADEMGVDVAIGPHGSIYTVPRGRAPEPAAPEHSPECPHFVIKSAADGELYAKLSAPPETLAKAILDHCGEDKAIAVARKLFELCEVKGIDDARARIAKMVALEECAGPHVGVSDVGERP
jgi:hypothetical protein